MVARRLRVRVLRRGMRVLRLVPVEVERSDADERRGRLCWVEDNHVK